MQQAFSITAKLMLFLGIIACSSNGQAPSPTPVQDPNTDPNAEEMPAEQGGLARITAVVASGDNGVYTFEATISSPDTGCDQYADWWEVINLEGDLIYRRILTHSHVNEQPFTRGGAVTVAEDRVVYIRAHMNNNGYGSQVYKGSVATGFEAETLDVEFAKELETADPLPQSCAF